MIKSFLLIGYRNIIRQKLFSVLNISGLAIGLAAVILIIQYVGFELSFDSFNEKYDRIYRITNDRFQNGKRINHSSLTYPTIGPTMAKDFPEIQNYTRVMSSVDLNVRIGDRNAGGERGLYVDERFLSVFSYKILAGNSPSLLKEPYTVVITQRTAKKYYQLKDDNYSKIIGKTFLWGFDTTPYTIKGVCEDIPENSHLQFDVLISYASMTTDDQSADLSLTWAEMRHYLVLAPGTDYKSLENKFPAFSKRYFKGDQVTGSVEAFHLQPLRKVHLYSDFQFDFLTNNYAWRIWTLSLIGFFILIIASINYVNLITSRILDRAREVGLRKVIGASNRQLIDQFMLESFIITIVAFVFAIAIVLVMQTTFNEILSSQLSISAIFKNLTTGQFLLVASVLSATALLSGFYPSFVLASYQPAIVLSGKFSKSLKSSFLRRSLVFLQFTISAVLLTCTYIISHQIDFMENAGLGFHIKNMIVLQAPAIAPWDSTYTPKMKSFKNEINSLPGVISSSTSWNTPGDILHSYEVSLADQPSSKYSFNILGVDHDFFATYDIALIKGRSFLPDDNGPFAAGGKIIINKCSLPWLGFKNADDAIGKELLWDGRKYTIIGVVMDFHQESLQKEIEPTIFLLSYNTYSTIVIRTNEVAKANILPKIERAYKYHFPGNLFKYSFLEENFGDKYRNDNRFKKVAALFSVIAIFVSCLGLIGLSSYTTTQRKKEVGIRKILGASLSKITVIMLIDFLQLVLLGAIFSVPISYFGMNRWLQGYAYHLEINFFQFAIPLGILVLVSIVPLIFQVRKLADTNPVEVLKEN